MKKMISLLGPNEINLNAVIKSRIHVVLCICLFLRVYNVHIVSLNYIHEESFKKEKPNTESKQKII